MRDWLRNLARGDTKSIGEDIKTLQIHWPLGMPLVRKLDDALWELRSQISSGIVRIIFTIYDRCIVLLHGFVKKSNKVPLAELAIARRRLNVLRS